MCQNEELTAWHSTPGVWEVTKAARGGAQLPARLGVFFFYALRLWHTVAVDFSSRRAGKQEIFSVEARQTKYPGQPNEPLCHTESTSVYQPAQQVSKLVLTSTRPRVLATIFRNVIPV